MQFLSTSPLRGTTNGRDVGPLHRQHFYPRPPCGGRPNPVHAPYTNRVFLSTSPLRGTTVVHDQLAGGLHISIHVPLAGDDGWPVTGAARTRAISIHVPLAGDDGLSLMVVLYPSHFYPRPPCGGRRGPGGIGGTNGRISIHVPLAGDDGNTDFLVTGRLEFLSTSPLRGTTSTARPTAGPSSDFYPRPPCGGRLLPQFLQMCCLMIFLSTSPLRGTTVPPLVVLYNNLFLSTSPLRGTTVRSRGNSSRFCISIHVPLAGDDDKILRQGGGHSDISIHVPLAGDDPGWQ